MEFVKKFSKYKILPLFIIIFITIIFRIIFIEADPPEDLSFSSALYTDEGFKVYESRNLTLFGDWRWTKFDEYPGWKNQSPLSVYTYAFIFKLLGVGFSSIRIVSILYSVLTLLLLFFFVNRNYGKECAFLCSFLYATNFFIAMYNRLGFYETHLNFYLMAALFALTEAIGIVGEKEYTGNFIKVRKISFKVILVIIGIAAFALAFFIKKSIVLVFVSVLPGLIIILINKYNNYKSNLSVKIFSGILLFLCIAYLILAHIRLIDGFFHGKIFNNFSLIDTIIKYSPDFDLLHLMFGKALFVEAIFLQPVTFFLAIVFGIYSIQQFLHNPMEKNTDFIISCWFVFGFMFLTLLKYHPSRYYMLISIPLIILCGRAVINLKNEKLTMFILNKQGNPFNILKKTFALLASAYVIIAFFFHIMPFKVKKFLMHWIYGEAQSGFPNYLLIVLSACFFISAAAFIFFIGRKNLHRILNYRGLIYISLLLIFLIQIFQYGKWALYNEKKMINISKELGREIESDAVLAGSWSAGLVLENKNRALIVQTDLSYNSLLLEDLILGKGIPVLSCSAGQERYVVKKNIPLYLTVSPDTSFEKKIFKRYEKYLEPGNLFKTVEFGYFNVNLYKIIVTNK